MNTLSDDEWEAIRAFLSVAPSGLAFTDKSCSKPRNKALCNDVVLHPLNLITGRRAGLYFDSEGGFNKFIDMIPILAEKFNAVHQTQERLWDGEKGVSLLPSAHNNLHMDEVTCPSALSFGNVGTGRYSALEILNASNQFIEDNKLHIVRPKRRQISLSKLEEVGIEVNSPHYTAAISLGASGYENITSEDTGHLLTGLFTAEQWAADNLNDGVVGLIEMIADTIASDFVVKAHDDLRNVLIQINESESKKDRHITTVLFKTKFQNYYTSPDRIFQAWWNDLHPMYSVKKKYGIDQMNHTQIYNLYRKTPMFKEYKREYERIQSEAIAYLNYEGFGDLLDSLIIEVWFSSSSNSRQLDIEKNADGFSFDLPSLDTYDSGAFSVGHDYHQDLHRWFPKPEVEVRLYHKENTEPQAWHVLRNLPKIFTELETYHKVMSDIVALTHRDDGGELLNDDRRDEVLDEIISLLAPFDYAVMKGEEE
jgi:hypothetical protein